MRALVAGKVDYMCDQAVSAVPQLFLRRHPRLCGRHKRAQRGFAGSANRERGRDAGVSGLGVERSVDPKGTPKPIVEKLNAALVTALDDAFTKKRLVELGAEIPNRAERTPEALARLVEAEIAKWTPIIKASAPTE